MNDSGPPDQILSAIREAPADDAPRHVLADWYEVANDLPRARLIRLQLQRSQLPHWAPEAVILALEERAILREHAWLWRRALPKPPGLTWGPFERGMPASVAFSEAAWIPDDGPAVVDAQPVTRIMMRWFDGDDRRPLPALPGVRELTVVGPVTSPDDMNSLVASPLMSSIRRLNFLDSRMDAPALARLLESPHVAQWEALRITSHHFGVEGVRRLVDAGLSALTELDLSLPTRDERGSPEGYYRAAWWQPTIDPDGAALLASWPRLAQLTSLNLSGNRLGVAGCAALLSAPGLAGLKKLALRDVADSEREATPPDLMAVLPTLAPGMVLDELNVGEMSLFNGPSALNQCPAMADLKVLKVDNQRADIYSGLDNAAWLSSLRMLSARNNTHGTAMVALLKRHGVPNLHSLDIASEPAWAQYDYRCLADGPPLGGLLALNMGVADADHSLRALGPSDALPALVALYVKPQDGPYADIPIDEGTAEQFATSPLGARLRSLELGYRHLDRLPRIIESPTL